jgi:hypothetical protein
MVPRGIQNQGVRGFTSSENIFLFRYRRSGHSRPTLGPARAAVIEMQR